MSRSAKSIKIMEVVRMANQMLLNSHDDLTGERKGIIALLEQILNETENYRGFGYLDASRMKASDLGARPGIIREEGKDHVYPDKTRVSYYINP